ncbi:MAG: glycosyltransferase [Rhodocyclaceae bacterium]|nr:MAG: glycosyltransferase [Rhodocyclaceae bacterium]
MPKPIESPPSPRVTLIMTVRERHQPTLSAIESVLSNTVMPFRMIYADVQSPPWLSLALTELGQRHGIEVVRFDQHRWPQQVRKALVAQVETEYVVFLDNDLLVYPGWLENLVACADQTGAGLVGPLYLWGDGQSKPVVHMAGGVLEETPIGASRLLVDRHQEQNADLDQVADRLERRPCDFLEFHCMLFRRELAQDPEMFDADICAVHEHIDTALLARRKGYGIYLEPTARVLYRAFISTTVEDLPLMRQRWASSAVESSIAAFCAKWNVLPDDRSFGELRKYTRNILARNDPLRPISVLADLNLPLRMAELSQTRAGLFDLAQARGYGPSELALLNEACALASRLLDGGFRPCGRPFVNHLIGTACVLVRYDLRIETVVAGLLHAAYTHGRITGSNDDRAEIARMLGGAGSPIERRVRAYTEHRWDALEGGQTLTVDQAELAIIEAANEIDMRYSGEYEYSGRPAELSANRAQALARVCTTIGVGGMAQTLDLALRQVRPVATGVATGIHVSYRLDAEGRPQSLHR